MIRARNLLVLLTAVAVAGAIVAVGLIFEWPLPRVVALAAFICLLAVGLCLWLISPSDSRWSAFGQAIFGSALLAAAVWAISEFQRAQDERQSLRVTVGLQKDLSGADLSGKDLSDVQLAEKILAGADLTDADLEETSLVGSASRRARRRRSERCGPWQSQFGGRLIGEERAGRRGPLSCELERRRSQGSDADRRVDGRKRDFATPASPGPT